MFLYHVRTYVHICIAYIICIYLYNYFHREMPMFLQNIIQVISSLQVQLIKQLLVQIIKQVILQPQLMYPLVFIL